MKFETLYSQFADLVYHLSFTYVKNKQDAEEVTQDVFVKLHQKLDSFRGQAEIKTWVYRICINSSLDFIKAKKSKKRSPMGLSVSTDDVQVYHESNPEQRMLAQEAYDFLLAALDQLSDKQKAALILAKMENKSNPEVAEIMELSLSSVESLIFRGKQNLKKALDKNKNLNINSSKKQ